MHNYTLHRRFCSANIAIPIIVSECNVHYHIEFIMNFAGSKKQKILDHSPSKSTSSTSSSMS